MSRQLLKWSLAFLIVCNSRLGEEAGRVYCVGETLDSFDWYSHVFGVRRNESYVCFDHWGTAAYLKFLVDLIFHPDPKLKAAVETCLLLQSTLGWHTAETSNSLHLPPPTLQLRVLIKSWVNTQLLSLWSSLLSAVKSGRKYTDDFPFFPLLHSLF